MDPVASYIEADGIEAPLFAPDTDDIPVLDESDLLAAELLPGSRARPLLVRWRG